MTDRKKPGVAFWATVAMVVVLVGYPLSFGPACWWLSKPVEMPEAKYIKGRQAPRVYQPIEWLSQRDSRQLHNNWWATIGTDGVICVHGFGDSLNVFSEKFYD